METRALACRLAVTAVIGPGVIVPSACDQPADERGEFGSPSEPGSTAAPTTAASTTAASTTAASPPGVTPGAVDSTGTTTDAAPSADGPIFDVGEGDTTGSDCVPTLEREAQCDGIDDDCNGLVDDVDEGGDGICDCLSIAIVGVSGSLAASEFEQWLIDRGTSAERIDPPVIDGAALGAYDVVILDQLTRPYEPAEAAAFEAWVMAGGGLMAMTGHTADPVLAQQRPNSILSTFSIEYQGALLNGPVTDFLPHPVTMGLSSVTFLGGFEVVETMPGTSEVIGQLGGPVPVARVQERGAGKVFVWGDEWIEYDSEWEALPEITVMWTNIFEWLAPAEVCSPPAG